MAHEDVDDVGFDDERVPPHRLEQLSATKHHIRVLGENEQQLELTRGQLQIAAAASRTPARRFDPRRCGEIDIGPTPQRCRPSRGLRSASLAGRRPAGGPDRLLGSFVSARCVPFPRSRCPSDNESRCGSVTTLDTRAQEDMPTLSNLGHGAHLRGRRS
jgi:hypothetical protein